MRHTEDFLLASLTPLLILLHLYLSPYTKVEESFNLQAVHDILEYGISLQETTAKLLAQYDHFTFPGAVPRTFVGALALAGIAKPFIWLSGSLDRQLLVRAILGLFNAFSILAFRNGVARAFGRQTANWYLLLQASQFHIIFYASRTLPNMFAFGLSTLALRGFLPTTKALSSSRATSRRLRLSIGLLTIAGVIFRAEVAILLATHTIYLLYHRRLSLAREVVPLGIGAALLGVFLTITVDSFFWLKFPLWPELAGFYYNAIEGKSTDWGTNPWHFYFTNAIPRLLMNPLAWQVCIPLAVGMRSTRKSSLDVLVPLLAFLGIYSFQPHKEWRFVIYVVPGLTAVAAIGASWIWTRRSKTIVYRFLSLALIASTVASFAVSFGMLAVSRLNYPGAVALSRVHDYGSGSRIASVHMDTLSCTTGITRFLEKAPPQSIMGGGSTLWIYDKTEDSHLLLRPSFWDRFDYVLAEKPEKVIGRWEILEVVDGFSGVGILRPGEGTNKHGELWKTSTTGSHFNMHWLWHSLEVLLRKHVTRDWWIGVKMEPKIKILRKQTGPYNITPS